MGLVERLQTLFRPRDQIETPVTLAKSPARTTSVMDRFAVERTRHGIIRECREMYDEDPRVQGIIQTLARDATKGGFELSVEGPRAREAEEIALEMLDRVKFEERIRNWVDRTLRDGDTFLEVAVNQSGDIVHLSRKPTLEIFRWTNEHNEFFDPTRAFYWTDKTMAGLEPPEDAVWFAEWQIIHAKLDEDENTRYSKPLLAAARRPYKRMNEGELDIAIRRKTRAGMKFVHILEDATETELEAYMERNRDALDDPFSAVQDYFTNKRGGLQAIQGDATLGDITDVLHHIRTFWTASPAPMSLLGYGQDLNRDVLDEQKEQYDSTKEDFSQWVTGQFVKPLVERQWLFRGIWPDNLNLVVEWGSKQAISPETLNVLGQGIQALNNTGLLSDEALIRLISRFITDFDADAEIEAIQQRMADEAERVATAAAQFGQSGPDEFGGPE